jgi:hypothetical protein
MSDQFIDIFNLDEDDLPEIDNKKEKSIFDEFLPPVNSNVLFPSIDNLKEGQLKAFHEIINFVVNKEHSYAVLTGAAGTGKSYLLEVIVQHLVNNLKLKVAITGTTNRAVKLLRRKATIKSNRVLYNTLHKLLGVKIVWDDNGNESFEAEYGEENKINDYDVIIIDESSQLDNKLFAMINHWADRKRIIFCGDKFQTPPVNHKEAIPITPSKQEEYNMLVVALDKIQRQAEGSPIIELSRVITNNIFASRLPIERVNNDSVTFYNQNDSPLIMDKLKELFVSDSFKKDADYAKVCCWQRDTVKKMNYKIRNLIYKGQEISKIMIGEKLVADKPIIDGEVNTKFRNDSKSILFNTSDEFEVRSYTIDYFSYELRKMVTKPKLVGPPGLQTIKNVAEEQIEIVNLKYYNTVVSYSEDGILFVDHVIKIIHEDSEAELNRALMVITTNAKKEKEREIRNSYWAEKRELENKFAKVIYNYAITTHKAQGGTYQHCFVLEVDIMKNNFSQSSIYDRNRIFYTAITRPSDQLYIIYKQ